MIPVRCRECMYRDRLVRQDDGGRWCPVREARVSLPDCPDFEPEDDRWEDVEDRAKEKQ